MAIAGSGDAGALAIGLRREVTSLGLRALAAKMLHVAVLAPERLIDIYDNAAAGWLSGAVFPPRLRTEPPLKPSAAFWRAFWKMMDTPVETRERVGVTARTARLAGLLPGELNARVAAAAAEFPGVPEAAAQGLPKRFDLARLATAPPASLGAAVYRGVLARGGVEVIDRDLLGLAALPPPLDYVNTEILQCHDVWALVGGYSPAPLDEIALAAFQLAQFGHQFSGLLVGIVMSEIALERPPGLEIVLESVFRGWTHGRQTPLLLGAPWETYWELPVDRVRAELGVTAFDSPFVAAMRQWRSGAQTDS